MLSRSEHTHHIHADIKFNFVYIALNIQLFALKVRPCLPVKKDRQTPPIYSPLIAIPIRSISARKVIRKS